MKPGFVHDLEAMAAVVLTRRASFCSKSQQSDGDSQYEGGNRDAPGSGSSTCVGRAGQAYFEYAWPGTIRTDSPALSSGEYGRSAFSKCYGLAERVLDMVWLRPTWPVIQRVREPLVYQFIGSGALAALDDQEFVKGQWL